MDPLRKNSDKALASCLGNRKNWPDNAPTPSQDESGSLIVNRLPTSRTETVTGFLWLLFLGSPFTIIDLGLLIKCTLHRDWSGLGFSIAGGRGVLGPQADASTIYISRIVEGGAADKTGQLRVGDQLYKINGIDVRSARHDQVITLLTGAGPNVELEVLRKLIAPQAVNSDLPPTSPIMNSGALATDIYQGYIRLDEL
ncbi:hypothetical protein ACTXT7_009208 [Hymenolepis weldensis]